MVLNKYCDKQYDMKYVYNLISKLGNIVKFTFILFITFYI